MKPKEKSLHHAERMQGYLSVLPVIVLELVVLAYPLFIVITKSFTNWNGLYQSDFVGFRNFVRYFADPDFWLLLQNSFILLLCIPLQALAGLIIAMILYEKMRFWKLFRFVYYLPSIISMVTVGYLFKVFFSYTGPINRILNVLGLEQYALEWLGMRWSAILVVLFCLVWSSIGWQVLVLFGGLSAIPTSIFEAAIMDGAGYWRRLFKIVLPLLVRTMEYSFISCMIWLFTGIFPLIHTLTGGGPALGTTTIDYMIYTRGFNSSRLGQASALSVVLLVIILGITKLQMVMANKIDNWGA
ncbi:sugar ABC transporter permease [Spirochaetia bacterium]|nr:sugar ABC transporter permease [Spirochaetia bacterium]